ncbi:hypothetical protein CHS0354_015909 [Potamilus streckersoni]|uniref:Protein FAM204A n=1 Tax=Potamilus streckersoni TaxID=2493646 RepID=A0AAE0SEC3_9BIVA|nr:hypothetical protein CHS0354_015909 [Potamilus streckersoni]
MYCRIPPPVTEAEDNIKTEDTHLSGVDSSSQLKRPSVVSQKLWERFQTVAKKTDEVTSRSTEKRIKHLQKSIISKVIEEISHPDDLEILRQHDVKFGPPVRNEKKTSIKETVIADPDNDLSQSNEEKWKEIKNYFHVNDHISKTGYVKDDHKSGLAKEIDAAISRGSYEEAEKLSERLSSRDFGRKIAEAVDARDYLKRKQLEELTAGEKRKKKLKWGFDHKQRWETKSNM